MSFDKPITEPTIGHFQVKASYDILMNHMREYGNYDDQKDKLFVATTKIKNRETGEYKYNVTLVIARSWLDRLAQYILCNKTLTYDKSYVQELKDRLTTEVLTRQQLTHSNKIYASGIELQNNNSGPSSQTLLIGNLFNANFLTSLDKLSPEQRQEIRNTINNQQQASSSRNPSRWLTSVQQRWFDSGIATEEKFVTLLSDDEKRTFAQERATINDAKAARRQQETNASNNQANASRVEPNDGGDNDGRELAIGPADTTAASVPPPPKKPKKISEQQLKQQAIAAAAIAAVKAKQQQAKAELENNV